MATRACTHSSRQVCIPMINWRSVDLRSALESFTQSSRSEERGAFRFLLWWLFLHRRLRSGNEAQLSLNRFCSLRRVLASGCHSFLFEWLEKVSQPSLAEPFGSDSGVIRIDSRLSLLSISASPRRLPIPLSVSKAATLATGRLILLSLFEINFLCVLFCRRSFL